MRIYHYHPETLCYAGAGEADESPMEPGAYLVPAYATRLEPPEAVEGMARVFVDGGWHIATINTEPEQETPESVDWQEAYHANLSAEPPEARDEDAMQPAVDVEKNDLRERLDQIYASTPPDPEDRNSHVSAANARAKILARIETLKNPESYDVEKSFKAHVREEKSRKAAKEGSESERVQAVVKTQVEALTVSEERIASLVQSAVDSATVGEDRIAAMIRGEVAEATVGEEAISSLIKGQVDEATVSDERIATLIKEEVGKATVSQSSIRDMVAAEVESATVDEDRIASMIQDGVSKAAVGEDRISSMIKGHVIESTPSSESIAEMIKVKIDSEVVGEERMGALIDEAVDAATVDQEHIDSRIASEVGKATVSEEKISALVGDSVKAATVSEERLSAMVKDRVERAVTSADDVRALIQEEVGKAATPRDASEKEGLKKRLNEAYFNLPTDPKQDSNYASARRQVLARIDSLKNPGSYDVETALKAHIREGKK